MTMPMPMEDPNYKIANFLREMGPLQYREPRTIDDIWVFWSKEEGEGEGCDLDPVTETLSNNNWKNIKEYLKYLLGNAKRTSWANVALIQFWAPTTTNTSTIGKHCILQTSNQPFGFYGLERRICEYRKHCTSLEFHEDDNKYELIWQVFRYKKATYDWLDDFARKCGIGTSYFLPLFKPFSWCCSGVLEISVAFHSSFFHFDLYKLAKDIFKEANFMNPPSPKLQKSTEIEVMNKALQVVCTTHQLPLANIWIPCCTSTAMACVDSPGERCHSPYLSCSSKFSSSISQNGRSVVGKALLYHKPCFCRDFSQIPMAEYLSTEEYDEELSDLDGRFAIWLYSTCTNHDYVLEFLFSPWKNFYGVLHTGLELLLATVKKQLPGFKISSAGEESCVEVNEISVKDDEPNSVIIISHCFSVKPVPESFANEKETVQDEVVGETVIDNGSNILGLEQNGVVVVHSDKTAGEELFVATDDEITISLPPMSESLRNEHELVQQLSDDEPTMEEAVRKNGLNVGIVKQTNASVTSPEREFSGAEESEREYRTTDITLSRKDLTKHFGKKLDEAARILKVSRSTMKRACRHHNIKKWPAPKRRKVNALRVCSGNEGIEGTYKAETSCSDPPPRPTMAGISYKTSNSRLEQNVGTVTIKATHGGHTIRFQLPHLSRKSDLVEKVTTRLLLNEGSFNIQYQDEENEWVLISCDEDLEECIGIWKGKSIIKMLVQPITNQAP